MQMNELPPAALAPDMLRQLGQLTRQLHDALDQLGLMPRLQHSAAGLPDARSRLDYIALKTSQAADRVLTSVERAKQDQARILDAARRAAAGATSASAAALAADMAAAARRTDEQLTEIMLAQDFHDLTGQVVAQVAQLAIEIEDSLVRLLRQAMPAAPAPAPAPAALCGPQVGPARADSVTSQREVDELLASLGL